jgi:carbonic anhydrase
MQTLIEGYHRFRATGWPERRRRYEALAEHGQKPEALVIACVDSRVDPAVIFDAAPGELLTIRNVANLVPPYGPDGTYHGTSAALEFGIRVLQIPQLVVLGHGQCGGVRSLMQNPPAGATDFIADWMNIARPARTVALRCDTPDAQLHCCELECVKLSLANLRSFPWIAERLEAGTLTLHGAWFAIRTGELAILGPDGQFSVPQAKE